MKNSAMKASSGFASLSSTLLARKGGARPAMRPSIGSSLDDLGWNDMGEDLGAAAGGQSHGQPYPEPLKYQEAIAEEFAAPVPRKTEVIRPVKKTASRIATRPETAASKVAFTLRLDAERHLRLRLACAVSNRSAQKMVTDALDAFLQAHPEIDELVGRIPPQKTDGLN